MSLPFYKFISFCSSDHHILTACLVELVLKQFLRINPAVSNGICISPINQTYFPPTNIENSKSNLAKTLRNGNRICLEKAQGSYKRLA